MSGEGVCFPLAFELSGTKAEVWSEQLRREQGVTCGWFLQYAQSFQNLASRRLHFFPEVTDIIGYVFEEQPTSVK